MKIGIVVDNELNNDIRVLRETGILKEQGFEIFILCFGFFKEYKEPVAGIHISRIKIPRKLKNILFFSLNTIPVYEWLWASEIRKFTEVNDLDFLHVHDLYMARAAYLGIKSSTRKIPLVLDLHENYPYTVTTYNWTKGFLRGFISRPEKWKKKEHEYLGYADRIIVLSMEYRAILITRYPDLAEEDFVVLPNVPDLSQPEYKRRKSATNPFKQNYPIIFYYGVIAERRGIFDTLRVFTSLVSEGINVNLLLIGPVDKKDKKLFSELVDTDLLAGRIHYIPWIESPMFPDYLELSDICLAPFHKNPQHESGVANKIYDYMLGGKPLVASNCKPQKELIEKHGCGIIYNDMTEFHDAIIKLLNDKALRKEMGENGRIAIFKEYNTDNFKENLVSIYKNITIFK